MMCEVASSLKAFPRPLDTPDCVGWEDGAVVSGAESVCWVPREGESGESGELVLAVPGNAASPSPQAMLVLDSA